MTIKELIAEGERLAKPSLLLNERPSDTGIVAYWGGRGRQGSRLPAGDRHWITLDCAWLANHGIRVRGSLGVYEVDSRRKWPMPISLDQRPDVPLSRLGIQDGIPLYGHEAPSFPPFEAVCLYGGSVIDEWLDSLGAERTEYDALVMTELAASYQQEYRKRCPLFRDEYAAVLAGWHTIWPDDEFYIPREMRLLLWTFRDAEPWIEVFERAPNFPIRVRIT
jgi:hypothetical protein